MNRGNGLPSDQNRKPSRVGVVGASGQLGSALCERLAGLGCDLALCGIDGLEQDKLAERLREEWQISATASLADVTQPNSLAAFFASIDDPLPAKGANWVVINAGIGSARPQGDYLESADTIDNLVSVNFLGCLNAIRASVSWLSRIDGGRIIVVSSLASLAGSPENPAYAATKAGIRVACLSMQPALAKRKIAFTLAHPGFLSERTQDGGSNWRPFAMSPDAAADRIVRAALGGRAETAFPWQMAWFVRAMAMVPAGLRQRIYGRVSGDPEAA